MTGYLLNFCVYTLAMTGIIFLAFLIAKKSMLMGDFSNRRNQFLAIENSLSLGPRRTLYVIRAGKEKFLISGDFEKNSFLTKLEQEEEIFFEESEFMEPESDLDLNSAILKFKNRTSGESGSKGIMRDMVRKLNSEDTITELFRGN